MARHRAALLRLALLSGGLACLVACQSPGLRALSMLGLQQRPFVMVVLIDGPGDAIRTIDPFSAYRPLQDALAEHLGRPVAVDACFPFQFESCADGGWYDLAFATPAHYAALRDPDQFRVVAVPVDAKQRAARSALLVTTPGSTLTDAGELRRRVVAFGPARDARTHYAGLLLLRDAGINAGDLSLEVLPIPGSLKHMPSSRSVAQSVMNLSSDAGFVDEAAWEAFPQTASAEGQPSREQLRVIGRTIAVPDGLVLATRHVDDRTLDRVREFFLHVDATHPDVLDTLDASGYVAADPAVLDACRSLSRAAQ